MAIQTMTIDPNASDDQTGDEIIAAIDAGSTAITREGALDQDNLKLIKDNAQSGDFKVKNLLRDSSGNLGVEYDDVVVP